MFQNNPDHSKLSQITLNHFKSLQDYKHLLIKKILQYFAKRYARYILSYVGKWFLYLFFASKLPKQQLKSYVRFVWFMSIITSHKCIFYFDVSMLEVSLSKSSDSPDLLESSERILKSSLIYLLILFLNNLFSFF